MTSKELTPAELKWVNQNSDAVRALMLASPAKPTKEYPIDPINKAVLLLTNSIKKKLSKINSKEKDVGERIERYRRFAANESPDIRAIGEEWLADDLPDAEDEIRKFAAHKAALEAKLAKLRDDPHGCFLPLGTIVKFIGVPSFEDSLTLSDTRKDYPVAGSIGVVTRLNYRDECFLGVSLRREFKTGWNDTFYPDYERVPTFFVDPEMLEVIGYSRLPDGSEYHGYDFIGTHELDDGEDPEMVLEADGFFWRLHDFGGMQGMECLQAYEDLAEMNWITGPVDRFRTPTATAPTFK